MMRLEKAIEIVSLSAYGGSTTFDQDYKDAQKLLIEAAKRLNLVRSYGNKLAQAPLPGEETL